MEKILEFITTNYLWFLAVTIVLILALVGYFVDVKKESDDSPFKKVKEPKNKDNNQDVVTEENIENVKVENNISLQEMINNSVSNNNNNQQ